MTGNLDGGSVARARAAYVAAALATIALGLAVYLRGSVLAPAVRDVAGDALWAAMVYAWVGAVWPRVSPAARGSGALAFAFGIEFSQCYHAPGIDAVRATTLGHLVLGSAFDARDLLSYAGGVGVAVLAERSLMRVVSPRMSSVPADRAA